MKKLILVMFMLVGLSGFTQKQGGMSGDKMTPEERADMMTQRLTKQLDLTAEQQAKVKALYLGQAQKHQEMMDARKDKMMDAKEKMKDRRARMRAEMMADRKKNMEQLKAILTEDQFNKFEEMQKERQQKMRDHSGNWGDRNGSDQDN